MKTAACILTLLLITCPARGQLFAEASQTLREADHVKMVLGDLDRAATLYEGVAESPSASRSDVARALYSLAEVTEPSDPEEAARLYQRVATEFPDVSASFQAARDALQRLGSTSDVAAYDYTLIMEEMPPTNIERFRHFAVSPDGERFAVVAPATETRRAAFPDLQREVYISDLGGGVRRPLVEDPTSLPWMHNPRWSPNGRYVAVQSQSAEGFGVVVVNVATGESSVYEGPDWTSNRPVVWMPDSETFLLMQGQEIGYRSIRGDVVRDIPFGRELESDVRPGGVSPDGQYLLYQSRSENSELNFELDIWVMELTTGQHRQLTSDLGTEAFPFWNADGTAFFFSQGTEHVRNIVRQTFDDRAERSGITSYLNARATHPVYLARSGKLAFVLATTNSRVMKSEGGTSEPLVRGQMAELSPDGETVYYLSTEPGRTGLWAAELDGSSGTRLMSGQVSASYVHSRLPFFTFQYCSAHGTLSVGLEKREY